MPVLILAALYLVAGCIALWLIVIGWVWSGVGIIVLLTALLVLFAWSATI